MREREKKKYLSHKLIMVPRLFIAKSRMSVCVQDNELTIRDWANHVVTVPWLHDYTFSLLSFPSLILRV
jgi:hypothetical protein